MTKNCYSRGRTPGSSLLSSGALLVAVLLALGPAGTAVAKTASYTGALASPEDTFQIVLTLSSGGTLSLQTWGFGGGTNAAGTPIPPGGFDSLVAVFSGTGAGATMVDGTSDLLTNYSGYQGCPPTGTVPITNIATCGDITMSLAVSPGTYTILLSDAAYIPQAIFDNGTLGEGFSDLTGGSLPFQTCLDASSCINDSTNWALDITSPDGAFSVPEPATWSLAALALLTLLAAAESRARTEPIETSKGIEHELVIEDANVSTDRVHHRSDRGPGITGPSDGARRCRRPGAGD